MGNISSLSTATSAATALSGLILVSPQKTIGYQPQNAPTTNGTTAQPPASLLFHYEGEQSVSLESDITDHYIEDNTALQDQISLKPELVTTHGFIGELNDVAPAALAAVQAVADKLVSISNYVPTLSATALLAYNEAFQLYQVGASALNSAVQAWATVTNSGGESYVGAAGLTSVANQNKQQIMFQQFYGYWASRTLFTVQTPWAVFQNMAIKSLRAIQDADTNVITDFEVQFKRIRIASTQVSVFDPSNLQGRAAAQGSTLTDLGSSTPASSMSLTDGLSNSYPGLGVSA
jgi:hypothetical protein